jgi:hypothetical protein
MRLYTGVHMLNIQIAVLHPAEKPQSSAVNAWKPGIRAETSGGCGTPASSQPGRNWGVCICMATLLPVRLPRPFTLVSDKLREAIEPCLQGAC